MFGDVQHTIRDAQYRDALSMIGESPPECDLPVPTESQLDKFCDEHDLSLEALMDSPIGVYCFKEYLSRFYNVTILFDFLIQYEKVKKMEAPDLYELEELVYLAEELPTQYSRSVRRIQRQLRRLQEAEESSYEGTVENDSNSEPEVEAPFAPSTNRGNDTRSERRSLISQVERAGVSLLAKIRVGRQHNDRRQINFGAPVKRMQEMDAEDTSKTASPRGRLLGIFKSTDRIVSAVGFEAEEGAGDRDAEAETQMAQNSDGDSTVDDGAERFRMSIRDQRAAKELLMGMFKDLGDVLDKKTRNLFLSFQESKAWQKMCSVLWVSELPLSPSDFRRFRILGKGAFGAVSSVKHKFTGQLTAMKMMNKKLVKGKRAWPLVNAEKEVLQILGDNPSSFTIWLKYAFQDADYFYMALPLCTGGDLAYHLQEDGTFSVERTRFYVAEIFEGLAHLHDLGIIYRDLKPENVILDADGHCRISDMGLAAITKGTRIKSKAGTPGYWAPEVLVKLFYSYPVDFWSLGVVMFEFLVGCCPFSKSYTGMDRDKATRYWPIKYPECVGHYRNPSPEQFPPSAKALLKGLLKRRASRRFSAETIREHPFFEAIDWEDLRQRRVRPPFLPSVEKINAGASRELEDFSNERMFKHVEIKAEDKIKDYDYISKYAHELDFATVLAAKKRQPSRTIQRKSMNTGSKGKGMINSIKTSTTLKSAPGCSVM